MKQKLFSLEEKEYTGRGSDSLAELILQLLLMTGFLGVLFCFLSDPAGRAVLIGETLILCALMYGARRWLGLKKSLWLLLVVFGMILMFVSFQGFRLGLLSFLNQWIEVVNRRFNSFIAAFSAAEATLPQRLQVLMLLTLFASLLTRILVERRLFLSTSVWLFAILLCGSLFRLSVNPFWFAAAALGWLGIWYGSFSNREAGRLLRLLLPGAAVLFIFAGFAGTYGGSRQVTDFRTQVTDSFEHFRYGEDTLPQGDLTRAAAMHGLTSEEALTIETSHPSQMYLRGFTGGTFTDNVWQPTEEQAYHQDARGMIDWLAGQRFYSCLQYASYLSNTGAVLSESAQSLRVENVGADRRFLYLPYEAVSFERSKGRVMRDWQVDAKGFFGAKSYRFDKLAGSVAAEQLQIIPLNQNLAGEAAFEEAEQVYRTFVYKYDSAISEEDSAEVKRIFFEDQDWSRASFGEVAGQIRLKLQELATYKEKPTVYRGTEPFLPWFLETAKKGNSAYFATAAALAFRSVGIPARYVEGYYLSAADAAAVSDTQRKVVLSQANAHAWTEVYIDQAGWMPFETVPGFYFAEYTTKNVLDAPTTSINVANQEDENLLNGSTADSLEPRQQNAAEEKKEELIRRSIHVIGIGLCLALSIWLLHLLIRFQRVARLRFRTLSDRRKDQEQRIRDLYSRVVSCLSLGGMLDSADRPYQNEEAISMQCGQEMTLAYHHFVVLIQKSVFGGIALTPSEVLAVRSFEQRLAEEVYGFSSSGTRWRMKYWKALL